VEDSIALGGMAAIPIITAVLQAAKGFIPMRALPLAAIAIGIVWNVSLTVGTDEFTRLDILRGVVYGLAASGFYSITRTGVDAARNIVNGRDQ